MQITFLNNGTEKRERNTKIMKALHAGYNQNQIAKRFKLSRQRVSQIVRKLS